jgi:hypothetical protein
MDTEAEVEEERCHLFGREEYVTMGSLSAIKTMNIIR